MAHDSNCDNSTAGEPIHCEKNSSSTDAISIDVDGVAISTSGTSTSGIKADHDGGTTTTPANITIDVAGTSTDRTISTSGSSAFGIEGNHSGTGNVDIDVEDITITTSGSAARGIYAEHSGTGNVDIDATGVGISATGTKMDGSGAEGVFAHHTGNGNIAINIRGKTDGMTTTPSTITTAGGRGHGIWAQQPSHDDLNTSGDVAITLGDTQITTGGNSAHGVFVQKQFKDSGALTTTLNSGTTINTTGAGAFGVQLSHEVIDTSAAGNDITLTADGITVTTTGESAYGLWASRPVGRGDITMDISDSTVTTENTGDDSIAIYAYKGVADGDGNIDIDVTGGSTTTKGRLAFGIYANHQDGDNRISSGDITIDLLGHTIRTEGTGTTGRIPGSTYAYGLYAVHWNAGNIVINLQDHPTSGDSSSVTTLGKDSHGIVAYHFNDAATPRTMNITVGGPVTVSGDGAQGVRVGAASGGVAARVATLDANGYRDQTVTVDSSISSQGPGIYLANGGKVIISPTGSIDSTSGIAILATGDVGTAKPKLLVTLNLDGRRVGQALGDDWIINDGGGTTIVVNGVKLHDADTGVVESESVPGVQAHATNGAMNVWVRQEGVRVTDRSDSDPANWVVSDRAAGVIADRDFSSSASVGDFVEEATSVQIPAFSTAPPPPSVPSVPSVPTPPPEPEPEPEEIEMPVVAEAGEPAAVIVQGDGTVTIGPQGSLRAASGIAILATPEEDGGPAPELQVNMNPAGRPIMQVIGDDWIINDGGGTTITINGVKLHDGTTGVVPGAVATNGAFNVRTEGPGVRIREAGVRVLDRTDPDPANWVISEPAEGVIEDRDFSAADFVSVQEGTGPEVQPPMLVEEYAPRAALYEVLPDLLLRLNEKVAPVSPMAAAGVRVFTRSGSHEFESSTVGAHYDTDVQGIEAVKPFALGPLEASATLQYLNATAEVSSPVQGGDIDVEGLGLSLQLCRGCAQGKGYVSGQLSFSRYDLDLVSDTRGRLKSGVDATASALHLEAGRHLERETLQLTPRVRLDYANVSVDRFTDAVDARISYSDETRLTTALGILAESEHRGTQGNYTLWGSLDVESRLDGARTTARVSGERLKARAGNHSLLLGAGATWTWGALNLDASLRAREELDTSGEDYTASLHLGVPF